jgi:transposase
VRPLDGVHQQEMVHTMKTAAGITGTPRRQHEKSFKAELVARCLVPGASVAAIALAGGINANLLFKWRRDHLRSLRLGSATSSSSAVLVPVHVASAVDAEAGNSQSSPSPASTALAVAPQRSMRTSGIIELDVAGAQLRLRGPVDEVSLCSVLRALRQST